MNHKMLALFGGVLALLLVASMVGAVLARRVRLPGGEATVANLNARAPCVVDHGGDPGRRDRGRQPSRSCCSP
ncbi:MAG: hypothetical protein R3F17_14445 [Planctomycetota bacterium]